VKQAPSRCPRCLREFDRVDTRSTVNPGAIRPGVQGPFETAAMFPEIWTTRTDQSGRVVSYAQELPGYEVQFISCRQCENVTLSVEVDQRSFLTQEEAEALCQAEGFTFVRESSINPSLAAETLAHVRRAEAERRIRPKTQGRPAQLVPNPWYRPAG
jgi:hypothetical protein